MNATDSFVNGIEKLLQSNLLTAGREIRSFLILLAEDNILKETVRAVGEDFRFADEYRRIVIEKNGLPKQHDKVVAFVTALLFAVDTREIALADLVANLYPDCDQSTGYGKFITDYLMPYAENFVRLLIGEPVEEVRTPKATVYDKMNEDVTAIVKEITEVLNGSKIPADVIKEAQFAANGLIYALSFNDALLTRNAYLGFHNTLKLYGIYTGHEDDLARTLRLYGVL